MNIAKLTVMVLVAIGFWFAFLAGWEVCAAYQDGRTLATSGSMGVRQFLLLMTVAPPAGGALPWLAALAVYDGYGLGKKQ